MNVAIFGGTFNPVHNEHINIALAAKRELSLGKIIIMPSNITPQKQGRLVASATDRLNMCHLAFGGIEGAEVSDYETKKGGISYSYLTCREFADRYPDAQRYFIVGGDMLECFENWKNPQEILNCVTLAACAREDGERLKKAAARFEEKFGKQVVIFNYVGKKVSSTRVRALAALGESLNGLTAEKVENYINANSVYAMPFLRKVKGLLKQKRYEHSVRVTVTAAENCARAGVPEEKAIVAAALHDCAKELSADSPLLKGFSLPEGVPQPVAHQYSGAFVAKNHFGVEDEEILNAIRYHTTGRENMTPLEKLIFLADLLEEGRTYEGVEELRKAFAASMDNGLRAALKRQVKYLESTGGKIDAHTLAALKFIEETGNDK